MRIRSIRPEFWTSSAISSLSIEDRLLFIGLWSYVDDNGVGIDKVSRIAADLFADDLEMDPRETFARVSRGLARLSEGGRIIRYEVSGKHYLAVVNFDEHQRIDKPGKARYPAPTCENAVVRETVATPSRESRETPATGEGEKGRRGEGDSAYGGADVAVATPTAQTLVAEWIDHNDQRPPERVIGQVSKEVKNLLSEGIEYDEVRRALAAWHSKGLHPSALASVLQEMRVPRRNGRPTTDDRVRDHLALAAQLRAEEAQE